MLFDNLNKCLDQQPNLTYDEACLDIFNIYKETITLVYQYDECYKCNFQNLTTLKPNATTSVVVKTSSPMQIEYSVSNTKCHYQQLLYEHYRYGFNVSEKCPPIYIKEPADDAYLPILMAFVVLFSFGTIWYMVKCIYKNSGRLRQLLALSSELEEDLIGSSSGTPLVYERSPTALAKHSDRLKSIDTFRGLCIAVMIFVNYGGGQYWFFKHSVWNGLTIADLVFPWFVWLMGFSLSVSLQRKIRTLVPKRLMIFQVIRRSFILMLLGIVINSNANLSTIADLRIPGVLQRIGIVYLVVGILEVVFTRRTEVEMASWIHDVAVAWPQWLIVYSLIIIHASLTFLINVPGCGTGYLGPGGLEENGLFYNCTGGAAGFIDRAIFNAHMYKDHALAKVYEITVRVDPEGVLGTLTAILSAYFGAQAGRTLNTYQSVRAKVVRWIIWGVVIGLIGTSLCGFSKNDGPIPINKKLWSLSFALVTSGMAFIIEAFLYVFVDITKKWGGRPLFYPGMNSILLYVGHELFKKTFPFGWVPTVQTHGTYLFMNLWGTFLWVSISIWLYKNNVFFKI
ncbi:unnamed protein product [Phyllotreta striolata]|uniref:Heparan-alpha-glucosaminide N-acetyltransferase n=1 Tax=Phyllotreta striolata TaxID=444603 RepID=A0A9N9TPV6_PHYSR|nr:unnamed protein product [Phyllotreta striolata]